MGVKSPLQPLERLVKHRVLQSSVSTSCVTTYACFDVVVAKRSGVVYLQNMGWTPENILWLATRGGEVLFATETGVSEKFETAKLGSRGFGILDVG